MRPLSLFLLSGPQSISQLSVAVVFLYTGSSVGNARRLTSEYL